VSYSPNNPWYNVLNYGVVADGVTDDTTAWNTLFVTILAAGGGTALLPAGRTSLCNGALNPYPFATSSTVSPGLRITGGGPSAPGDVGHGSTGASILDLRWNGGTSATITAVSGSGTVVTFTATNSFTAGEMVTFSGLGGGFTALNGTNAIVLAAGLSGSQFAIASTVTGATSGTGTAAPPVAKIDTRGHAQLMIDHLTIKSGGTDDFPFFQTTNTAVTAHDLSLFGHSANTGTACVQDAFILGGTNISNIETGASDASFQGYSTRFERVYFENIRTGFFCRSTANAIVIQNCVWSSTCGGDTTHGAISVTGGTGNVFAHNLIEAQNYPYPFTFGTGSPFNIGVGNGTWAPNFATITAVSGNGTTITFTAANTYVSGQQVRLTGLGGGFTSLNGTIVTIATASSTQFTVTNATSGATTTGTASFTLATLVDTAGNVGNRFSGTYTPVPGDHPDVASSITITATGPFIPTSTGVYRISCVGGGGQGGGGSGAAAGCGGAGGGSGGTIEQYQTLIAGTTYTCTIGAGGTGAGGGGTSGNVGTAGGTGGATTFAGPTTVLAPGGAGGPGGATSGTTAGGSWAGLVANGGTSIAAVISTSGVPAAAGMAASGGGAGGIVATAKGGGGGSAGVYSSGTAAPGGAGASGTTAGVIGSNAAANTGAGGGGGGCASAATGGTGGNGGSGFIVITGPFPAN
jgi:hypothetical protein